ncbi:metalloregulator ArsR/SmtB family transcription factor [Geothrix sp. PMB-07]|nr:metalloregulator ArsR/SmtB family transcription factor [Geothrix sp. PMB-07]WLT31517.1 metalloregulator ArsR/SmtB family transcription factor [Geothrix sp. PMB-07]
MDLHSVLYALSDPTRLEIVRQLATEKERACGTFGLGASKATLSHHFKVLREAGLIEIRMEGVYRYNSLRRHDLDARFPGLLKAILKGLENG